MPSFFKKNIGWISICALVALPILRWFFLYPLSFRFSDINTTTTSLGQIFGLLGMAMFSINLILSSRLQFLEKFYQGMANLYKYHRRIGSVSFSLLLFHPLFLAVSYLQISLRSAALFLLPSNNSAINYGIIALASMMLLMVLTFYAKMKYHHWKISHKFLVIVFIFAILHNLFITSDITQDNILGGYMIILAVVGLAAGFYRAFLSKYFNRNFDYQVKEVRQIGQDIWEIVLQAKNKVINFMPGQFVFVRFFGSGISTESHPFSVASAPGENTLRLVIKSLGDYTSHLGNVKIGDSAKISGPFGKFSYKNIGNNKQIWLAGGIGITPFLSMARDLSDDNGEINLYYCVSKKEEAVFLDELEKISSGHKNFKVILWCSNTHGHITSQNITGLNQDWAKCDIMICGPSLFMNSLREQFLALGLDEKKIHWENFKLV